MSIAVAIASYLLIRGTPESVIEAEERKPFDWFGLTTFIAAMVALNVVIGQGAALGWTSPTVLFLTALFIVSAAFFLRTEIRSSSGFVDLTLFSNATYSGATLSNFLLNGAAGTLLVTLTLVQQEAGLSSLQSGLLTVGHLIAILSQFESGKNSCRRLDRGSRC
jgi:DHA2 family multidrug resistance protein-like MFS transporter